MEIEERLLKTREVAALFRVAPSTVSRWVMLGRIDPVETPGGQLRFRESDIRRLLAGRTGENT